MMKLQNLFFLLVLLMSMMGVHANAQTVEGDLNGDGSVGIEDVTPLVNKILGLTDGSNAYDINEDGKISIVDVVRLISIIVSNHQTSFQTCPDDRHPHIIDLGLPSGTKWACCNVGALQPEFFGGYYAWGETEVKDVYLWSTYIHCDGTEETCHFLGDICGTEYDVAHVKWGGQWHMPNSIQMKELVENCTYEWTTLNGKKGGKFTSKTNGKCIFLPADGTRGGSEVYNWGTNGNFWTGTPILNNENMSHSILLLSDYLNWNNSFYRYNGLPVRAVIPMTLISDYHQVLIGHVVT